MKQDWLKQGGEFPFDLEHSFTPPKLRAVNERLTKNIITTETDMDTIIQLFDERAMVIEDYINSISGSKLRQFAEKEMPVQSQVIELANLLRDDIKNNLGKFAKGRNALKKYK
jgi:hypothetical protein